MTAASGGFDVVVGPATLRTAPGEHWIGLRGNRIAAISPAPLVGEQAVDADGGLVIESFVKCAHAS